jgi:hypothetical protein
MATLIIIIGFLVMLHFLYEAIFGPTLRLQIRHELFAVRDSLHSIKLENLSADDKKIVAIMDGAINHALDRMPQMTIYNSYKMKQEYQNNARFKEFVNDIQQSLEKTNNKGIKNIDSKLDELTIKIFIVNMGGALIYLIPMYLLIIKPLYYIVKPLKNIATNIRLGFETVSQGFVLTPDNQYHKVHFS